MLGLGWRAEMYSGSGREESRSESRRYYNPYSSHLNLNGGSEQRSMENLYRLPTTPEFLFTEEATFQRRSFGENVTYFTGCGYLGGAVLGGMKGLVDGIRSREEGDTVKLRVNRVLNASGQTGRSIGNKLGVLGLLYAGMESGAYNLRGIDDVLNPVMAGLGTGAFYKAAAGPRTAAIAGALGGIAAGGIVAGKQACKRYLPI